MMDWALSMRVSALIDLAVSCSVVDQHNKPQSRLNTRGGFGHGGGRDSSMSSGHRGGYNNRSNIRRCGNYNGDHNSSNDKRPMCQVCKKIGHMVDRCWNIFDEDYVLEARIVAIATGSRYDNNWYTDSRATDHIISDLEKLVIRDKYTSND
jgi:hypothetical protein